MKKIFYIISITSAIVTVSCKKTAGEGGNSNIQGKIHTKNYNSNFSALLNEYPGADVDVYIIYGDEVSYGDKIKSGPDGVFEFQYLRKGSYKLYVYSKDSVGTVSPPYSVLNPNLNAPKIAVFKNVEISKKKEKVDAGTIEIFN
ncbi:MAG: hypothetical protein A3F72_19415 [Bacteroidetes bacterium RIFCSPLOWO2_12_FULL_35_15]|nr:MAG: hypothetical protein A3F72_19415 [Bacteroidetes bacterium RIFCSPLOWO2_12_FULL_35_15]